ncbi:uncharacterized protein MONOS_26 [Monocercomonoides exilis]|uniref:uncharacterized protein n=1 Tax=Monocercomonoides exilis TaxID=2049356 RepID=UPI0035598E3F|nr:hypothetical protein MONOS_26 [Monocercomonoides exilis]|eukprot:MONOS_26.1-p1 / transcript=MONOS_26.1 / gene=MONOS_26 / organism=Monocercomonoides_exilis_PA203 / gene_product=unspecified product / transcript_product=unspecified product / location=Mono_scaffold00001:63870-64235(+) / protein_length=122 / sequence_SO=supercontig / SO=protein_coding / is_pseudo=false
MSEIEHAQQMEEKGRQEEKKVKDYEWRRVEEEASVREKEEDRRRSNSSIGSAVPRRRSGDCAGVEVWKEVREERKELLELRVRRKREKWWRESERRSGRAEREEELIGEAIRSQKRQITGK